MWRTKHWSESTYFAQNIYIKGVGDSWDGRVCDNFMILPFSLIPSSYSWYKKLTEIDCILCTSEKFGERNRWQKGGLVRRIVEVVVEEVLFV